MQMVKKAPKGCPCPIGGVNSDCPFSYANGWHSQRDAMLLQVSDSVFKKMLKLTHKQRAKLRKETEEYDSEYFLDDSQESED